MIKPWLFEFFHAEHDEARLNDPAVVQQRFQDYIDIWVEDEKPGVCITAFARVIAPPCLRNYKNSLLLDAARSL